MKKYLTIILTAMTALSGIRGMNTGIDNLFEIGAGKENFEWG